MIGIGALVTAIVLCVLVIHFMSSDIDSYYQIKCMNLNNSTTEPRIVQYVHDSPYRKAGVYCILQNGSEKDITIRNAT